MPNHDLPLDEIRRELRDIDALQRESLAGYRAAVRRLFGGAGHSDAEQITVIGGLSRRKQQRHHEVNHDCLR